MFETNGHNLEISGSYSPDASATLYHGDCRELLSQIPAGAARLIVTSPPYNIGKKYERKKALEDYLAEQNDVIGLEETEDAEGDQARLRALMIAIAEHPGDDRVWLFIRQRDGQEVQMELVTARACPELTSLLADIVGPWGMVMGGDLE